jgi:hypothetical protein
VPVPALFKPHIMTVEHIRNNDSVYQMAQEKQNVYLIDGI